jgi:hypothetical protein
MATGRDSLLLPTSKLVVNSKGHAFLESTFMVCGETDDEVAHLKSKGHIEILGN